MVLGTSGVGIARSAAQGQRRGDIIYMCPLSRKIPTTASIHRLFKSYWKVAAQNLLPITTEAQPMSKSISQGSNSRRKHWPSIFDDSETYSPLKNGGFNLASMDE